MGLRRLRERSKDNQIASGKTKDSRRTGHLETVVPFLELEANSGS